MISFKHRGDFNKLEKFLNKIRGAEFLNILNRYGQEGVDALSAATPIDSGRTASSWYFEIEHNASTTSICWSNSHVNQGVPIAVIIQYGHGTGTGGYVKGVDYINPAMKPVFERIATEVWKEVSSL